jgi:hypothetical protein
MADCEQSQLLADVHHDNLRALALHRARMSLLSLKPMAGDRQDPAQGNPYKGVEHLAHFVSPIEIELACDPQMCGVWQELYRRRADGTTFLYPARDAWWERRRYMGGLLPAGALAAADASERQDEALLELLDTMLACKLLPLTTTTRRAAEQERERYLAMADELELAAITMRENPDCSVDQRHERWRRLKEAAKICTDYAHETHVAAIRTALDHKHDGRVRWVALSIANKLHELFGSPMYSLTATITSVVLGRTVPPRRVRHWCHPHRPHPADLEPKTTPKPHPTLQIWAQKRP